MNSLSIANEPIFVGLFTVLLFVTFKNWKRDALLISRLESEPNHEITLSKTPKVSLLIPAWNNSNIISQCIESFNSIKYPNKELIVIAGGEDGTYEIAKKYVSKNITILEQQPYGKNAALNEGFKYSTGEIIVLTDADCILSNSWFTSILQPIINESEDVTTGRSIPLNTQLNNSFVLYQFAINVYSSAHHPKYVTGLLGRNTALKREVIEKIGGFDETALTGTDYILAKHVEKNSYKIRFVPNSVIETEYPTKFLPYINQQSRWLRNTYIIGKLFGDYPEVRSSIISSLVGITMLLLPFSAILIGKMGVYFWLILVIVGFLNRIRYVKFTESIHPKIDFKSVYAKILIYMFIDFVAWSFALIDYLIPRRRRKW